MNVQASKDSIRMIQDLLDLTNEEIEKKAKIMKRVFVFLKVVNTNERL